MAHQSLYRRYRPRRFVEVRGQEHVVRALRNSVRTGTEGHAYLFSGPRGTGKTSTARILAKALNCEDLRDGEPCCECSSCVEMEAGRSFDLFELDAASNNGVDSIRDLVERAAVASPGRTKMYILDEVHMLTAGASNALLKTLEEPPEHVCFVLATTDPQKVSETIRSRTQHLQFHLLPMDVMEDHIRWLAGDAGIELTDAALQSVLRQGGGSARDTVSALELVASGGGEPLEITPLDEFVEAFIEKDPGRALTARPRSWPSPMPWPWATTRRCWPESFLAELRGAFLLSLGVEVTHLVDAERRTTRRVGPHPRDPVLTRAVRSGRIRPGRHASSRGSPTGSARRRHGPAVRRRLPTAGGGRGAGPGGARFRRRGGGGDRPGPSRRGASSVPWPTAPSPVALSAGGGGAGGGGSRSRRGAFERTAASGPPPADAGAGRDPRTPGRTLLRPRVRDPRSGAQAMPERRSPR